MPLGSSPALARGVVVALPISREPVAEARLVAVAADVSALVFDDVDAAGPLMAFIDGVRHRGALAGTRLALRSGGMRQVVLIGVGAACLDGTAVALVRGGRVAAAIDPDWLQSPDAGTSALFEDLCEEGALRLLRLLLTTGASLFRDGGPAFADLARRLLETLGLGSHGPVATHSTGTGTRLVTWRVPPDVDPAGLGDLVALVPGRPRRLPSPSLHVERRGKAALLHVELPARLPAGATLVGTGPRPIVLATPTGTPAGDIAAFLAGRDPATTRFVHGLIEARMDDDPIASGLAAELRHAAEPAPALGLRHLSGTAQGVLFRLGVDDPNRLVAAVRFARGAVALDVPASGTRIEGYARLPRAGRIDDRLRLGLVLRSGRVLAAGELSLLPFEGGAPAGFSDVAGLAAARRDLDTSVPDPLVETFGAVAAPRLSLVAPVAADLDLIRARAALIASERRGRHVEVVCWTADPALAAAARTAMSHAAAAWGVPHRLVVVPRAATGVAGLRAALDAAAAPRLLSLGASVLPAGTGWLERCLRLRADAAVLRLRDHDGTMVEDAGAVLLSRPAAARLAALPAVSAEAALAVVLAGARPTGADFIRYGGQIRPEIDRAADEAMLAHGLKASFTLGCEESRA